MYLLEHLKDLSMGVHSIQVIQKTLSELEIKFVPDDSLKDRALDIIRRYFQDALGDDIEVKFTRVRQIPREPSGKLRIVVCALQN